MTDLAQRLTAIERDQGWPNVRPRDAATLILLDRSGASTTVLMGRRHMRHKFMPGKFVFPGGRVEAYDGRVAPAQPLPAYVEAKLMARIQRPTRVKARAFAMAAIRETCEETGLLLGRRTQVPLDARSEHWKMFAEAGIHPDLGSLHFVARAITPPRRPRRFDTRFFAADASIIAHHVDGAVGMHGEFTELRWVPLEDAQELDLPAITGVVLEELEQQIEAGFRPDMPVPFYRMVQGSFIRELL